MDAGDYSLYVWAWNLLCVLEVTDLAAAVISIIASRPRYFGPLHLGASQNALGLESRPFARRLFPEIAIDDGLSGRASLKEFASGDPFFSLHPPDWRPIVAPPLEGHEVPDTHPWVDSLRGAARRVTGRDPVSTAAPYPCDAQINARFGIPTVLYGPTGAGAHNPDEYVEVESVFTCATAFLAAALDWCGEAE